MYSDYFAELVLGFSLFEIDFSMLVSSLGYGIGTDFLKNLSDLVL